MSTCRTANAPSTAFNLKSSVPATFDNSTPVATAPPISSLDVGLSDDVVPPTTATVFPTAFVVIEPTVKTDPLFVTTNAPSPLTTIGVFDKVMTGAGAMICVAPLTRANDPPESTEMVVPETTA